MQSPDNSSLWFLAQFVCIHTFLASDCSDLFMKRYLTFETRNGIMKTVTVRGLCLRSEKSCDPGFTIRREERKAYHNMTSRDRYALMAIFELAKAYCAGEAVLQLQQISESNQIPRGYLLQIMRQLGTAGILYSARGSKGGYTLARDPSQISIGDVIRAVNGPHAWLSQPNLPPMPSPLDTVWEGALREMMDVLNKKNFADIVQQG